MVQQRSAWLEKISSAAFSASADQYLRGGAQAKEHATPPQIPMEDYGLT
jgi:hypothetical protein